MKSQRNIGVPVKHYANQIQHICKSHQIIKLLVSVGEGCGTLKKFLITGEAWEKYLFAKMATKCWISMSIIEKPHSLLSKGIYTQFQIVAQLLDECRGCISFLIVASSDNLKFSGLNCYFYCLNFAYISLTRTKLQNIHFTTVKPRCWQEQALFQRFWNRIHLLMFSPFRGYLQPHFMSFWPFL